MWRQLIVRTVTSILGAIIADQCLANTRPSSCLLSSTFVVSLVLFLTSLPVSLNNGAGLAGLGGFIASILIIGIGTGGIKSNVAPLIAEQYQRKKMAIRTLASGERAIRDLMLEVCPCWPHLIWSVSFPESFTSSEPVLSPWFPKRTRLTFFR